MLATLLLMGLTAAAAGSAQDSPWVPVGLCGGGAMYSLAAGPHDPNVMMLSCDMSGAYVSRDGGRNWRMIHHAQLRGCTSCAPAFHPRVRGRIYAGNGWRGEVCVSGDYGTTWRKLPGRVPWRGRPVRMWVCPLGEDTRLYVGAADGLYVTEEEGRRWAKCAGLRGRPLGMGVDRRDTLSVHGTYVGTTEGVFLAGADGRRFEPFGRGLPDRELLSFAVGSNEKRTCLYATTACTVADGKLTGGVFVSVDHGRTWRRGMNPNLNVQTKRASQWANGDLPSYRFILTTDRRPERAYVFDAGTSYFPPNHRTVYRTDDGGRTWRPTLYSDPRFKQYNVTDDWLSLGAGQRWQSVPISMAISPADPNAVMLVGGMFGERTADGGRTWRAFHTGPAAGGKGAETAWRNNGLVVTSTWNYYADPHDPRRHYICYTDIGFARSLDGGRSWIWGGRAIPWHNTTYELAFDPAVPGRLWGAFGNTHDIPNGNVILGRHRVHMSGGVARSDDFGKTWRKVGLPEAPCVSVVLDPSSPKAARRLYASLFEKGVFRSEDGGATWKPVNTGLGHPGNMRTCKLHLHADGTLFVLITAKRLPGGVFTAEGVGLYRSTDRGEHWEKITRTLPVRWPKDFTVKPGDGRTILLSVANCPGRAEGGLYRTTDVGGQWKRLVQKGPEHFGAFYHPTRPGWIYMTLTEGVPQTSCGLWLSTDDGATWRPFPTLPFSNIQRVHFLPGDDEHIVVTTFGGSVYKGPAKPAR